MCIDGTPNLGYFSMWMFAWLSMTVTVGKEREKGRQKDREWERDRGWGLREEEYININAECVLAECLTPEICLRGCPCAHGHPWWKQSSEHGGKDKEGERDREKRGTVGEKLGRKEVYKCDCKVHSNATLEICSCQCPHRYLWWKRS